MYRINNQNYNYIFSREQLQRFRHRSRKRQHKQPECVTKQPATLRSSKERTSFPYEGDIRFCRPRLCGGKILKSSREAFRRAGEVDPEPLLYRSSMVMASCPNIERKKMFAMPCDRSQKKLLMFVTMNVVIVQGYTYPTKNHMFMSHPYKNPQNRPQIMRYSIPTL